jgi:hypothetical protein
MPLKSKAFQGNAALEACLIRHSAHVVPGARGEHVGKIQKALVILGEGFISPTEISGRFYGGSTANTVLAYKTKRQIINRSYQQTPDNIVGKMTIERLDLDMFDLENRPDPDPPPSSRLVSLTMAGAPHNHAKCPRSAFPGPDGRVHHLGTPINPQRFGRMINIGGEDETDYLGFEDFTTEPVLAGPRNRPLTSTLRNGSVSDICARSSPITKHGEQELRRVAMPGCRLTVATNSFSAASIEQIVARLGTIIERHILVDFQPPDGIGLNIFVAVMR